MCAFVVCDLVSSVLCQEIGWEEHLRNDLFCVDRDVKPELSRQPGIEQVQALADISCSRCVVM